MKYRKIASEMFQENRRRLAALLPLDAVAVLHSAATPWRCADASTRFIQNSDLFYLTGIEQEESVLILCPGHPREEMREQLFVRETSELIRIWEGHKLDLDEASKVSGIAAVSWTNAFDATLRRLARRFEIFYLNHNEHPRSSAPLNASPDDHFRLRCQSLHPSHRYQRLAPLLHRLRVEKSPQEIALIERACEITGKGFERILPLVKPGIMEYEIEAELLHEFVRHGSRGFAYEPIIASGENANVLHYLGNDQPCRDGDLILMDVAAEYANYNADLTRTIPVSGRFSARQRAVYDAVLRILRLCVRELIVPGKRMKDCQVEVARAMEEELIGLGLLDAAAVEEERGAEDLPEEKRAYRKYFMHGVSHSLGLDVHDVTPPDATFVENMCVTVEPGIYLPEEGFGVRLENDVIVRSAGNLDLMESVPIEADEIETLMGAR